MSKKETTNPKEVRNQNYEERGFNENSDEILLNYQNSFNLFESEFEI